MKKKILAISALLVACMLGGCKAPADKTSESGSESVSVEESTGASDSIPPESCEGPDSSGSASSDSSETPDDTAEYRYTDFTAEEKALFLERVGLVIPFVPNDEYYVEEYYDEDYAEYGACFYTFGNTQADFNAYREKFSDYVFSGTYEDDYGDTWYCYDKGDIYVDVSYYYFEGDHVIDLYVYYLLDEDSGGNSGSGNGSSGDIELITNAGKGLPSGENGVYTVDLTKATHVKNVTDQGYYLDGCPTVSTVDSNPAVLVIPVEFGDVTAASKGYAVEAIEKAFNGGDGTTDYYSVHDYYYTSSYGKLDLDITVWDSWFRPKYASTYYAQQTGEDGELIGDQMIMDEALAALESKTDLSTFDSDGNGIIDAVVLINTLDIDGDKDFYWAYRYWNMYTDNEGYYYEYDGVSANDYLWAPYQFLYEGYDGNGDVTYGDTSVMNTYTFIHEFGHVLGADDYYDTAYVGAPLDGCDIMDSMTGDHNAFTKFHYGWLTTSRLVVAEQSVTLTLEDFSKNGDTVIIANNWDDGLGAYQEYYIVAYYTGNGLNGGEHGYFARDGIVVYHVNASLFKEVYDGEIYYDIYNNNTDASDPDGYGTEDNLIELVKSSGGTYTYVAGDSLSASTKDDLGDRIAYTFVVDSLTADVATLTFTKNAA